MRRVLSFSAIGLAVALTGCGKSSSSSTPAPTTYSIGGTISGLTSGTVVLQDNGGDNLSLSNSGSFAFATALQPDASYDVTVATQPADGVCSVSNGSGTAAASVSNVTVVCSLTTVPTDIWTWVGGSDYANAPGVFGTQGTAAASNSPGARRQPTAWTDVAGNFWLFGGYGLAATAGNVGMLDDLWKYSPSAGQWIWVGGSDTVGAAAAYGSLGTPAASNDPGAREGAARWTDAGGNLWLFGGDSLAAQSSEELDDLWEYDMSSAQWTWMGGSSTAGNAGSYGMLGVALATNLPPARTGAISWVDSSGVFWLFGGAQLNANGSFGAVFNDLWSYNPTTALWTWMGGSNAPDAAGVYGTQGAAATSNVPGARMGGTAWVDASGNVWLFGGEGLNQSGISEEYGDLWEYSPGSGEWTWVGGSDAPDASGVYGTQGAGAAGYGPGARVAAASWTDSSGNFWLFGGHGYDQPGELGILNDLWQYSPGTGVWTWIDGSSIIAANGAYGTQGAPASGNAPGAREQAVGWLDSSGNLRLFGGYGLDAFGEQDELNDLWSFTPTP
jgi:N-acetylneuraminic acid mutarotase